MTPTVLNVSSSARDVRTADAPRKHGRAQSDDQDIDHGHGAGIVQHRVERVLKADEAVPLGVQLTRIVHPTGTRQRTKVCQPRFQPADAGNLHAQETQKGEPGKQRKGRERGRPASTPCQVDEKRQPDLDLDRRRDGIEQAGPRIASGTFEDQGGDQGCGGDQRRLANGHRRVDRRQGEDHRAQGQGLDRRDAPAGELREPKGDEHGREQVERQPREPGVCPRSRTSGTKIGIVVGK